MADNPQNPFADFGEWSPSAAPQAPSSSEPAKADTNPFSQYGNWSPSAEPESAPAASGHQPLRITIHPMRKDIPDIELPGRTRWGGSSVNEDAASGVLESFARGVGSGVTLNSDDELAAAAALHGHAELMNSYMQANSIGALDEKGKQRLDELIEQWKNPSQISDAARDSVRAANKEASENQPGANTLGQIAGGAMLPVPSGPATFGVRAARGAGIGSLYGGLAGFNSGEGTQDRIERGLTGAIVGGTLGATGSAALGRRPVIPGVASSSKDVTNATERLRMNPLPVGAATDNPGIQGVTQAARQLPFVGGMIDEQMGNAVHSLGEKVQDRASELAVGAGNAVDRSHIGEAARSSLDRFIDANDDKANAAFGALRGILGGGDALTPISGNSALVQTLQRILKERTAAGGEGIPMSDLMNIMNLATHPEGASFNGLQRARSDLDKYINWNKRNGGFSQGDLKQARVAMKSAMRDAIEHSATGDKKQALNMFDQVNSLYEDIIDKNNQLREFMRGASDEGIVDRLLSYGSNKAGQGNMALLTQAKSAMSEGDWNNVAGFALQKMGLNNKGEFSPPIFLNKWSSLSNGAKEQFYGAAGTETRQFIDDIATVSTRLQEASKYENKSNSARAVMTGLAAAAVFGVGELNPIEHIDKLVGAAGVAYLLSRPATASAMSKWSTAYWALIKAPSMVTKRAFAVSSRNFAAQIGDSLGVRDQVDGISQFLQPPPAQGSGAEQR